MPAFCCFFTTNAEKSIIRVAKAKMVESDLLRLILKHSSDSSCEKPIPSTILLPLHLALC